MFVSLLNRNVNLTDFNGIFWVKICIPQFYLVTLHCEKHAMKSVAYDHLLIFDLIYYYGEKLTH